MFKVVDAAVKIGELKIPEGVLIEVERSKNLFDGELVIVSTGTQGEPMSALTRMASGDFNKVTIGPNDTIIISATPIPGNEKMVYRVINNLYKKGANVVYESLEKIHVSGHACQEEHKILHNLLNPRFFIPVHGEYRHLKRARPARGGAGDAGAQHSHHRNRELRGTDGRQYPFGGKFPRRVPASSTGTASRITAPAK